MIGRQSASKIRMAGSKMSELYQKVAYIGLRKKDGSMLLNVPLYIKVSEVNKSGMTETQESIMHRISEIMIKQYEKQLSEYFSSLKDRPLSGN